MHKFLTFDNFLFEKLGVPVPMISYAKKLTTQVISVLKTLEKPKDDPASLFAKIFDVAIPLPSWDADVDVSKMKEKLLWKVSLKVTMRNVNDGIMQKEIGSPVSVEGSSNGYTIVDNHPVTRISVDMIAEDSVIATNEWKEFQKEIYSTILHELTHTYEDMMRKKHSSALSDAHDKPFEVFSNVFLSVAHGIPRPLGEFLFTIYLEASYELNARTAQTYALIDNVKDTKKRIEIIKNSIAWKMSEKLKNWSVENFLKSLRDINFPGNINTDEEKAIAFMNDAKQALPQIISRIKAEEEASTEDGQALKNILKNMNYVEKLFKKDPMAQLHYWEKTFHKSAEKTQRKLLRLASYDDSPEEK
jgi:hypothetical protein